MTLIKYFLKFYIVIIINLIITWNQMTTEQDYSGPLTEPKVVIQKMFIKFNTRTWNE